jgi:hypothetical protein
MDVQKVEEEKRNFEDQVIREKAERKEDNAKDQQRQEVIFS